MNLIGKQFGKLKVIAKATSRITSGGNVLGRWLCQCACGNEKLILTSSLIQGKAKSCGCLHREVSRNNGFGNKKHGGYSKLTSVDERIKFQALVNIKERSRRGGYESDLELIDLPKLEDRCPVLGVPYAKGKGTLKDKDFSPSIDRKNSNLPYLKKYKENLVFISHRANRIKSNASIEEIQKVLEYMNKGAK